MKFSYDPKYDILYIPFKKGKYDVSKEIAEGMILDLNKAGEPIGIEILDASINITEFSLPKTKSSFTPHFA